MFILSFIDSVSCEIASYKEVLVNHTGNMATYEHLYCWEIFFDGNERLFVCGFTVGFTLPFIICQSFSDSFYQFMV